jgi:peptide methionine sulfoxide reductase MsrA
MVANNCNSDARCGLEVSTEFHNHVCAHIPPHPSPAMIVLLVPCVGLLANGRAPVSSARPAILSTSRRHFCEALSAALLLPQQAALAEDDSPMKLYFGAGCFWHVQHELVLAEKELLGRSGADITAVTGYAGGRAVATGKLAGPANAKVCYHNPQGIADYGKLGHAEAVQVTVPKAKVEAFAEKYFALFGSMGIRHDPQDRGGEYRSVLGLPGGEASPLFASIKQVAAQSPMKLVGGSGDEDDTLGARSVLVYDSEAFPFYPAELYHQFHNDFQGPRYGKSYNDLLPTLYKAGKLETVGCPDMNPADIVQGKV